MVAFVAGINIMKTDNKMNWGIASTATERPRISEEEVKMFEVIYKEVCTSYHNIKELRMKLLAFLPLATSGIFLLLYQSRPVIPESLPYIGSYGAAVTVGLFLYELSNMRQNRSLIDYGSALEVATGIMDGPFTERKRRTDSGKPEDVARRASTAAGVVYGATALAWLVVAFSRYLITSP